MYRRLPLRIFPFFMALALLAGCGSGGLAPAALVANPAASLLPIPDDCAPLELSIVAVSGRLVLATCRYGTAQASGYVIDTASGKIVRAMGIEGSALRMAAFGTEGYAYALVTDELNMTRLAGVDLVTGETPGVVFPDLPLTTDPTASRAAARSIAAVIGVTKGVIVGQSGTAGFPDHSSFFTYETKPGTLTVVRPPDGFSSVEPRALADGVVFGNMLRADGDPSVSEWRAFAYELATKRFTDLTPGDDAAATVWGASRGRVALGVSALHGPDLVTHPLVRTMGDPKNLAPEAFVRVPFVSMMLAGDVLAGTSLGEGLHPFAYDLASGRELDLLGALSRGAGVSEVSVRGASELIAVGGITKEVTGAAGTSYTQTFIVWDLTKSATAPLGLVP